MKITENGIGSNYRTFNNDPISPFHDPRVKVEMYPSAWGKFSVSIICDEAGYSSGLREFETEAEAALFAVNTVEKLTTELDSQLVERVLRRLSRLCYSGR